MKHLHIIFGIFVLCNIAISGAASFDISNMPAYTWRADSTDTVAQSDTTVATDTLAKDSMAMDSVAKDSLATDSLAMGSVAKDSLATDSLAMDSLAKDSLATDSLAMDSLAKDSLAKNTLLNDSLLRDSLAMDSLAKTIFNKEKRVYVHFSEKPKADPDQKKIQGFIALYKKNMAEMKSDGYIAAYTPWKGSFEGCSRRTLDMYMDGIGILMNLINIDTLEHRYDRLTERREQILELYDLAVDNIDDLNAQIDRKRTKDTLSVAKLRATQLSKYKDCWVLDSSYNTKDTTKNIKYWKDKAKVENIERYWRDTIFASDHANAEIFYPRLKELVYSKDNNIGNQGYLYHVYYSGYYALKFARIINSHREKNSNFVNKYLKPEIDSTKKFVMKRYEDYKEVLPTLISKSNIHYNTIIKNSTNFTAKISDNLSKLDGAFMAGNDYEGWDKKFIKEIEDAGGIGNISREKTDEIIKRLSKAKDFYVSCFQALHRKWSEDNSFENTLAFADYAFRCEKYGDAYKRYDEIHKNMQFELAEHFDGKEHQLIIMYLKRAHAYQKAGGNKISDNISNYLELIELCPDDYQAYYKISHFCWGNKKLQGKDEVSERYDIMYAHEWMAKAREKFNKQKANAENYPNIDLSEEMDKKISEELNKLYNSLPDESQKAFYGDKYKEGTRKNTGVKVKVNNKEKDFPVLIKYYKNK